MRIKKKLLLPVLMLSMFLGVGITASAETGVRWSGTGEAWTTDYLNTNVEDVEAGTVVSTGVTAQPVTAQKGQHVYQNNVTMSGDIPIGYWDVAYPDHYCIHNGYPNDLDTYKGFIYGKQPCLRNLQPGWIAHCACCGRGLPVLIYATSDTVRNIKSIDTSKEYVSTCAYQDCLNMEQAWGFEHECDEVSWNKYTVQYLKNGAPNGYMPKSTHYYNNETVYEGKSVPAQNKLSKHNFWWEGMTFIGWNTERDGSGISFKKECDFKEIQEALNLGDKGNNIKINLYAQWKPASSTLNMDMNGGSYNGETSVTQRYRTTLSVDAGKINPPAGPSVSFDTQGGNTIDTMVAGQSFKEWTYATPFHGRMEDGIYTFGTNEGDWYDGCVDTISAQYSINPIILPSATKADSLFGGWYLDPGCTQYVGFSGEKYWTQADVTLYAKWSVLHLDSEKNWSANDGKGAVNLSWIQNDNAEKFFKVYQTGGKNAGWKLLCGKEAIDVPEISEKWDFTNGSETAYTVPYTGIYEFDVSGAQGGNYDSFKGGYGGEAKGRVYLKQGEVLYICAGGQNGASTKIPGGGATSYGTGGGGSYIYRMVNGQPEYLAIAGGGGGASPGGDGGAGGSGASLRPEVSMAGSSGMAGGGGGNRGGNAGELIVHSHVDSCWASEDTSYVLLDGRTEYMDSWIRDNKHTIGVWGDYHSDTTYGPEGKFGSGAHKRDDACNAHSYYGLVRFVDGKPQYIYAPTNGNPVLELHWSGSNWGGDRGPGLEGFSIAVYNEKEECIFYKSNENVVAQDGRKWWDRPYTEEEFTALNGSNDYTYGSVSGRIDSVSYWGKSAVYINEWIDISDCKGIRIDVSFAPKGGWYGQSMSYLAFTGGSNVYTTCGYTEGQVISSKPAYGGSNYVSPAAFNVSTNKAGEKAGNGSVKLTGIALGVQDTTSLASVKAPDLEAPGSVNLRADAQNSTSTTLRVWWEEPGDNGTWYSHYVDSHTKPGMAYIMTSNITHDYMASGISRYIYRQDTSPVTNVSGKNGETTYGRQLDVARQPETTYLHVAAVDKAGNRGPTSHITIAPIGGSVEETVYYPISTQPVHVTGLDDNVYSDSTGTYVRADGETPFYLDFVAGVNGTARGDYQINRMDLNLLDNNTGKGSGISVYRQNDTADTDGDIELDGVELTVNGNEIFGTTPYMAFKRYNSLANVSMQAGCTAEASMDGHNIFATPRAGALQSKSAANVEAWEWSDEAEDNTHGLTLTVDGKAPDISGDGYDFLVNHENIDRDDFGDDLVLELVARDSGSGIRYFKAELQNADNQMTETFTGTIQDDGKSAVIRIEVPKYKLLFSGDIHFSFTAVDNVGNVNKESELLGEFSLVTKMISSGYTEGQKPDPNVYKAGEGVYLIIRTSGYADRIKIEFPDEFVRAGGEKEKNLTYDYPSRSDGDYEDDLKQYGVRTELVYFSVPMQMPDKDNCKILITAYKDGEAVEVGEVAATRTLNSVETMDVKGSIVDGIRTVIVWN